MTARNATLVVIEFGASWPRWLSPIDSGNMAVVAQHYEGPADSLLIQVRSRMSRVVAGGWRIDDVILASNGASDPDALSARSLLARELVAHLREVGGLRLVLTVEARHGRRASHTLTSLGAALQKTALSSGVALRVRIGERAPIDARPATARAG